MCENFIEWEQLLHYKTENEAFFPYLNLNGSIIISDISRGKGV